MKKIEKNTIQLLIDICAIIILIIIQTSFIVTWSEELKNLNIILSFIIFIALVVKYYRSLYWCLICGIILDIYSIKIFGTIALSLLFTVIITNFLFNQFFTNRSYYTLFVLSIFSTLFYHAMLIAFDNVFYFMKLQMFKSIMDFSYLSDFLWQLLLNTLFILSIFFVFNFISKRTKNAFLPSE